MHVIGQRLEARTRGRGKPARSRRITALCVQTVERVLCVPFGYGIGDEPLHVDHYVFPTEGLQVLRHPIRVGLHLRFIHSCPIRVPTVPPDRKSTRLNSSHANISYAV